MTTDRTPEDDGDFATGCAIGLALSTGIWAAFGGIVWAIVHWWN